VRINLQDAAAARLEIDLSSDGEARLVSLTGLRGVTGELERGSSAAVRPLRVDAATLAELEWPLPARGRLSITSPAMLSQVAIELDAEVRIERAGPDGRGGARASEASEVTGWGSAARAEADAIAIDLPGGLKLALDADLTRLRVEHTPERVGHAAADHVALANLQAVLGGVLCRLSGAALEHSRVDWGRGELLVGAAAASLSGMSVAVPGSGLTVEIDRVELPGGLRTSGGAIVIPELVVPELRVAVDDVVALFSGGADKGRGAGAALPPAPARPPRAPFDFGFLDRITGRLGVDMTLDISVPLLGRREGTHRFRVPISGGLINYRELERDLSNFEDAFIDVEVRGKTLVIERAIPLIPGLEKPLVVWDLDPEELELARRRLVRLRTIPRLRLAVRGGGDRGDRSSLAVRSLRFDAVDIDIAVDPPAPGKPDSIARASAGQLRVSGRLVHEPNRTAAATELTTATVRGSRLAAGPLELLGVEIESIELGALDDGQVTFAGLRPRGASFVGRDLRARNVKIALT